ncbi:hypothetical protein [Paenibacillus sp.]|jgi:hypothetical protein|uniref:hypothetical protein n=1 Tax=Paenibacillus sp. TaxID=58172 RepID=UPI00281F3E8E|nr:hypothetical protein [Paenibacillus sp.]MDR0268598.1 hypothetical protein [Paenibacillus sp.]
MVTITIAVQNISECYHEVFARHTHEQRGVRKMQMYMVSGRFGSGEYTEVVDVFENIEVRPNYYVCAGQRIDKSMIGKVEETKFSGSYQMALLNPNEVEEARKTIMDKVREYHQKRLEKARAALEAIDQHSLESDIKFIS